MQAQRSTSKKRTTRKAAKKKSASGSLPDSQQLQKKLMALLKASACLENLRPADRLILRRAINWDSANYAFNYLLSLKHKSFSNLTLYEKGKKQPVLKKNKSRDKLQNGLLDVANRINNLVQQIEPLYDAKASEIKLFSKSLNSDLVQITQQFIFMFSRGNNMYELFLYNQGPGQEIAKELTRIINKKR